MKNFLIGMENAVEAALGIDIELLISQARRSVAGRQRRNLELVQVSMSLRRFSSVRRWVITPSMPLR